MECSHPVVLILQVLLGRFLKIPVPGPHLHDADLLVWGVARHQDVSSAQVTVCS